MKKITVLGVFRETSHSPRRESDDEAILRNTAMNLAESDALEVHLLQPDELLKAGLAVMPSLIFFMCEEAPYLARLKDLSFNTGCLLVNSLESVKNTFRKNMVAVLGDHSFFPASEIRSVHDHWPLGFRKACWLKRGDFHAISEGDVVFAGSKGEMEQALTGFSSRGIDTVMVQEHIPGDIIKFYCIRDCRRGHTLWFKWFYHRAQDLSKYSFSEKELVENCLKAGDEMGLDIYGGDAIVTPEGRIFVIDVNAWPSFALFRQEAAGFIARLLTTKLVQHLGAALQPEAGHRAGLNLSA